jgi:transposase InsO family protein
VIRGKSVKTMISGRAASCPLDHLNRQFRAERPNALWVSDFTYVSTRRDFVYVDFVIDVFARRIVGWPGPLISGTKHLGSRQPCTAHAAGQLDNVRDAED